LVAFAIVNFISSSLIYADGGSNGMLMVLRLLNTLMGFLGIISLMGMLIGIPVSIIFFTRRETIQGTFDPRSGKGDASIVPEEIKHWSWGGFVLGLIWGVYHQVWIAFLLFVPFINFVVALYLGMKGKELAWRKNTWTSVDVFKASQKKWDTVAIILFVLAIILMILPFALAGMSFGP
jgi:phosphate/sulfate permease